MSINSVEQQITESIQRHQAIGRELEVIRELKNYLLKRLDELQAELREEDKIITALLASRQPKTVFVLGDEF